MMSRFIKVTLILIVSVLVFGWCNKDSGAIKSKYQWNDNRVERILCPPDRFCADFPAA